MNLNEKLVELRKAKGLTQKELAEALNVTRQAVSRWEVGTAAPTLDNLTYLSRLYGVPLDDFIQDGSTDVGTKEPSSLPVSLEPVPANDGWSSARPALSLFLAILIFGVGILIGLNLPREKSSDPDSNLPVYVNGPVGSLERSPSDIEDELRWLEETVTDILEQQSP